MKTDKENRKPCAHPDVPRKPDCAATLWTVECSLCGERYPLGWVKVFDFNLEPAPAFDEKLAAAAAADYVEANQ